MTKQCLLYCAVFPKDDVMKAETLIRMWMAQGYLTTTNGSNHNQMELKGQDIFRNLAMRSFFQDLEKDDTNSKIKSYKMHDIVHDFVQFLTKNECYSTDRLEDKIKLENLRHLSWQKESISLASIHGIGKVCSFIGKGLLQEEIPPKLFNGLKSVRVLVLHGYRSKEIPKEIGNLLHLRYIHLIYCSSVKELPDAICSLYNLQTLYLEGCCSLSRLPEGIGNLINLRHLKLGECKLEMLPQGITKLTQLRTLDLEECWRLSRLPEGIGNLINLRDLNLLSKIDKLEMLPQGITKLTQLRTLDLGCRSLSRLPEGIGNLINLRHLNLSGCRELEMLPQGITKLTQLRTLGRFVVGKEGCELGDMEKLNQLQGHLKIVFRSHLNNTTDVEEAKKAVAGLRNKEHLNELALEFYRDFEVSIDVMEALKPPLKLQSLRIDRYGGTQLPSWITRSLDNLRSLRINDCYNCTSLPPLGKLPSLETLRIDNMKSLKWVGSEILGVPEVAVAFPKLKELEFSVCLEWEEWEEWDGLREATNVMPSLTQLKLQHCSKLKSVPDHLLGKMSPVRYLRIANCPNLKVDKSELSHIPRVDITDRNPKDVISHILRVDIDRNL